MARRRKSDNPGAPVVDYRHDTKRKNIPPAGLAAQGKIREAPRIRYEYDPHLPPVLRFDGSGESDRLPELLVAARTRALTADEARLLAEALRNREPWLEWAGKREKKSFEVEPVALHIHERIAAQAILKVAARQDVQRDLFADPQLSYREAVQFYQHDVDWANRMILGDSLQVMASLARREDLAGKVQMIYLDPPYGIRFSSNFQPEVGKRDVKDREADLTREPEMVKAYRDTWTLGVHSYLAYLRDRLILCRELLTDSGSIFVQISDENLHRVRCAMDEVFGAKNFVALVPFKKTSSASGELLSSVCDFLLWYCRDKERLKFRQIYLAKELGESGGTQYTWIEMASGARQNLGGFEVERPQSCNVFRQDNLTSQRPAQGADVNEFSLGGRIFNPGKGTFKTDRAGLSRLASANRLIGIGNTLSYVRYLEDFQVYPIANVWEDTVTSGFAAQKLYVVQTSTKVIERCLLMTTDPGDLVVDPTCGSGTTAYLAEQWGRRWITIDTSRVALALARQRLLTSRFDYYRLRPLNEEDLRRNPNGPWLKEPNGQVVGPATFQCKTVPHITLKSIAQNTALDPIFVKHQTILDEKLAALNKALKKVTPALRKSLKTRLAEKEKREGRRAITDADRRRWFMPPENRDPKVKLIVPADFAGWYEWEVPFDSDEDWPKELKDALVAYRAARRAKMDEVNAAIAANADSEELVDQPEIVRGVVRVSGPFTMEAVMPVEHPLDEPSPIDGAPEELETFAADEEPANAEAYLDKMLRLLKADGVRFPNNRVLKFTRLEPVAGDFLHAEGEWQNEAGDTRRVAVSVGPQYGPVTAYQVESALPQASRRGVEDLVFAGFSFDGAAQVIIQDDPNPRVRCHLAHIRPDVNMGGLLKETPNSQLFTVFGSPRSRVEPAGDGQWRVTMEGVDIYNPVENNIIATEMDKVAAWFLDTDYDGRTFCITQAFFPDRSAWDRLARALKAVIDEERFAALSGNVSLPFPTATHKRVAVKVIDPRGNEVMRVHRLGDAGRHA